MAKLKPQEMDLARIMGWGYIEALNRKTEWLSLPEFIRGRRSFSNLLEKMIMEGKQYA